MHRHIKKSLFILLGIMSLFTISCSLDKNIEGSDEGSNTLLIYMCASDLEKRHGSASSNIGELLNNKTSEYDNIILEVGGTTKWRGYDINPNKLTRLKVSNNSLVLLEECDNASMGLSSTLSSFIDFGLKSFKGDRNSLIIWNHGGGVNEGICYDMNYGYDSLSLSELCEGLDTIKPYVDKLDLIGFDACLMGSYEVMECMKPYTRNLIASPEIEPIGGWDYTNILEYLKCDDTLEGILTSYSQKCLKNNALSYTLSLIDMNRINEIEKEFEGFIKSLDGLALGNIVRASINSQGYGDSYYKSHNKSLIDLSELSGNLFYNPLGLAIANNIISVGGSETTGGLSIYFPENYDRRILDSYLKLPVSSSYRALLDRSYKNIDSNPLEIINNGTILNDEIIVEAKEATTDYIRDIEYKLSRREGNKYVSLGYDSDIKYLEKNKFSASANGKWLKWHGSDINLIIEERDYNVIYYNTPIIKNGTKGFIRLRYDNILKEVKALGFIPFSDRHILRMEPLSEGDTLAILHEDGKSTLIKGEEFKYSPSDVAEIGYLNPGDYKIEIQITDILGNEHLSNELLFNISLDNNGIPKINVYENKN